MDTLRELLPFLIPIILLQLGLILFALIDLARRPKVNGPKWIWVIIIIFVNFIGPIVYFLNRAARGVIQTCQVF